MGAPIVGIFLASGGVRGQIIPYAQRGVAQRGVDREMVETMICFTLRCQKDHEFEGWFKDSGAFESQNAAKDIECPVCGSHKIEKALSRPNISSGKTQSSAQAEVMRKTRETLREFREKIESTHENVGTRFAEEGRKIHYGETEQRGIYGETTGEEAQELVDEGVPIAAIPWIEEAKEN